jgi:TolB-like protein
VLGALLSAALPAAAQQQSMQPDPAAPRTTEQRPRPRVAVLEFERLGVNEAEGASITDRLRTDLVNLRRFTVLDRAQTEQVLKEMAFQQQGITDAQQAVRIGKLLNVEFIVTGRATRLSGAYQVNAQMIQVETAEVVRSETVLHRGDIIGLLSDTMSSVAARLADVEGAPRVATPVPPAAPPPAAMPYVAPAVPAAEPVMERKKADWALVVGGILVAVGTFMEIGAIAGNADAVTKADEANSTRNPILYDEAKADQEDAESLQSTALAVGAIGVVFLIVYAVSGNNGGSADAGPPAPPPVQLALAPDGGMRVGYALRW